MKRRPLAAILTLGCKLNLADSEEIGRGLRAVGYDVVDRMCDADAYVVNTCSVTHVADQKSRRLIRSVRRTSPHAAVAVTGCYPRTSPEGFIQQELGADLVAGTGDRDKERLVAFFAERLAAKTDERPPAHPAALHTRRFVKAQEGCNDVCAFCIVPRTRGRERSRSVARVVAEVDAAVNEGAREVVITGTQLGAWGRDLTPALLPSDLIAGILEQTEVTRLRFSSLQPQDITPELLALWQDPRVMPHFHLALQSGSEATLSRMRRRYTAAEFLDAAARIRAAVTDVAITTDVIAAFPGESETEFQQTLDLCREVGFARVHAFPYSPRARTAAAGMDGQLPPEVRKERMRRLLTLGETLAAEFRRRFAGTTRPVLWEGERTIDGERYWHGHTDNYISAFTQTTEDLQNRIIPARLGGLLHDGVTADVIGETI